MPEMNNKDKNIKLRDLIKDRWDYEKNDGISIEDYRSNQSAWIKCKKCHQSTLRKYQTFIKKPDSCLVCSGKIVIEGYNDFASKYPELINRWDYTKNNTLPTDYTFASGKKVWFFCQECNQSTLRSIANIGNSPNSCSICSGKIVIQGVNDFATLYPELLDEWDYEKNTKLPSEISKTSKYKVWWICRICGNSWQIATYNKIYNPGNGCGACAGQVLLTGFNDVRTKLPELAKEWYYEKNELKPEEILFNSTKKFWIKCSKCQFEYKRSPQQSWDRKNNRKRICPNCLRTHISYGEQQIYEYCIKIDPSTISNYKINTSNKEIDVFMPKFNLGIEFNGDYWHSTKVIQKKYNITSEEFHRQKFELAKNENIDLLFVWASDFYNDEDGIIELLEKAIFNKEIDEIFKKFSNEK